MVNDALKDGLQKFPYLYTTSNKIMNRRKWWECEDINIIVSMLVEKWCLLVLNNKYADINASQSTSKANIIVSVEQYRSKFDIFHFSPTNQLHTHLGNSTASTLYLTCLGLQMDDFSQRDFFSSPPITKEDLSLET